MSDWFDNISSDVITQNDQCVDAELQVEYEEKHLTSDFTWHLRLLRILKVKFLRNVVYSISKMSL